MAYIMLPGMGGVKQKKSIVSRLAAAGKSSTSSPRKTALSALSVAASAVDPNIRANWVAKQRQEQQAANLVADAAAKVGVTQQAPSQSSVDSVSKGSKGDILVSTPPVTEKVTAPEQLAPYQEPSQSYADLPPAEETYIPTQSYTGAPAKKGIDKRLLIGGGIAAAALVAAFTLMD